MAQVGLSIEPLEQLQHQVPAAALAAPTATDLAQFTRRAAEALFNYAASFARGDHVPLSVISRWYETYSQRLQREPDFWRHSAE